MLPEEINRSITSIDELELEELYTQFNERNEEKNDDKFISELYKDGRINAEELKNFRFLKKIDATAIADLSNVKALASAHDASETNSSQDDFTILESIDEGGMAKILLARDNELGRTIAYKKIHPHVAEVPGYLERFFMEAQITAQLQHPNIVPVYEMKADGGNSGYVMKLIQGKTLKVLIDESREKCDEIGTHGEHDNLSTRMVRSSNTSPSTETIFAMPQSIT